jgi:hypothetical protein
MHLFSQVSHITVMPLKIRIMVHHNLRGKPLRTTTDIRPEGGEGKREDNIIFFRWTIHLFKIQVAPRPMSMDSTPTCPPIPHNWSKTCNGSMSMRIQSSITCWCNTSKQLPYGRDKHGRSTMLNCGLRRG